MSIWSSGGITLLAVKEHSGSFQSRAQVSESTRKVEGINSNNKTIKTKLIRFGASFRARVHIYLQINTEKKGG